MRLFERQPRVRQKMKRLRATVSRVWHCLRGVGDGTESVPVPPPLHDQPEVPMESKRFIVINRLGPLVGVFGVEVLGAKPGEFARASVPIGRVIEVTPGADAAIAKLLRNHCIEPYDSEKHADAILDSPPEQQATLPAWVSEPEPGREIEAEMREMWRQR